MRVNFCSRGFTWRLVCAGVVGLVAQACIDPESIFVWRDETTGLSWQGLPASTALSWGAADAYCSELVLDASDDWRLPDIGELRSIVQGCDSGGTSEQPCAVTSACTSWSGCFEYGECGGCNAQSGPGEAGFYLPSALRKGAGFVGEEWSTSRVISATTQEQRWTVVFKDGSVSFLPEDSTAEVRCVH